MQGILKNPLASPFTLGIASAAGFGASLAIILGAVSAPVILPVGIMTSFLGVPFFVYLFLKRRKEYW